MFISGDEALLFVLSIAHAGAVLGMYNTTEHIVVPPRANVLLYYMVT